MSVWHGTVRVDSSLLVSRARGDSPFVTFPARCGEMSGECALPIGHLSDHLSISDAWSAIHKVAGDDV